MKKFARIIPALLAASMLAGCSGDNSPAPSEIIITGVTSEAENAVFPVKLADGTMIDHAPESAASLSPAATEILAELGYSDRLTAVCRYCDFPEGLTSQTAGSSENPDIDKLTDLHPEVLFTTSPYVPFYPGVEDRLALYLDRLSAVCKEGVERLLQAHGRLREEQGAFDGRVEWLISHRERRLREYRETVERTPGLTGVEITLSSPSSANIGDWDACSMIVRWCVVSNGMAVLDHLLATGQVAAAVGADGVRRYLPAR